MDAPRGGLVPLSLVIPAYNEERVIERAVWEAERALESDFPDYELLVVDDGSSDRTAVLVSSIACVIPRLRVLRHSVNRGYGAALRTGFQAARFPLVAFTDADCQFDLTDLRRLAAATTQAPIVVGYRVDRQDSLRRRVLSRGYNWLVRRLLGIRVRDCDCALKVFHRDVLSMLLPQSRGFLANAEMLTRARLLGYPIAELPVAHRPRAGGQSKVSLSEVPRTLAALLPFWWREVVRGRRSEISTIFTARIEAGAVRRPVVELLDASAPLRRAGLPGRQ